MSEYTFEHNGHKYEISRPVDSQLESKVWTAFKSVPRYAPAGVNEAHWMAAAAREANDWYLTARKMAERGRCKVDLSSLARQLLNASCIGLSFGSNLGLMHLTPRHVGRNRPDGGSIQCTLIVGYKGFIELAKASGEVEVLTPIVAYKDEPFEYWIDEHGPHITHRPNMMPEAARTIDDIQAAYVVARAKSGQSDIEVVPGYQIQEIAKRQKNVWTEYPEEMAKKTPIRRMAKRWAQSSRLTAAVRLDEQMDAGEDQGDVRSMFNFKGEEPQHSLPQTITAAITEEPPLDPLDALDRALVNCTTIEKVRAVLKEHLSTVESEDVKKQLTAHAYSYAVDSGLVAPPDKPAATKHVESAKSPTVTQESVLDEVEAQNTHDELLAIVEKYSNTEFATVVRLAASVRKASIPTQATPKFEQDLRKELDTCNSVEDVQAVQSFAADQCEPEQVERVYAICDEYVERYS